MDCCKSVVLLLAVTGLVTQPVEGFPSFERSVFDVVEDLIRASRIEVSIDFTKCQNQGEKSLDFIFSSQMDGTVIGTLYGSIGLTGETSISGQEYNISDPITRVTDIYISEDSGAVTVVDMDFTRKKTLGRADYICSIGKGASFVQSTTGGYWSDFARFVNQSQEGRRFGAVVNLTMCNSSSSKRTVDADDAHLVYWEIRDYHFNDKGDVVFTKTSFPDVSGGYVRATHNVTFNRDGSADIVYIIDEEKPTVQSWHCSGGSPLKAFNVYSF